MSKLTDADVSNALNAPTEAEWEAAAEEVRAAGHRVERGPLPRRKGMTPTESGYSVYPGGAGDEHGLPAMTFGEGSTPDDLRRLVKRKNPMSPKGPRYTDLNFDVVQTVDGTWMVLVNGFQWGPPGYPVDRSGAYNATWPTKAAALAAYREHSVRENPKKRVPHGGLVAVNKNNKNFVDHSFVLWFGAYGDTKLLVYEDSLDDALETAAEWLKDNAPGFFTEPDYKDAAKELGVPWPVPASKQDEVSEHAETDLTYTESGYIPSWEWGIVAEDPTPAELGQLYKSSCNTCGGEGEHKPGCKRRARMNPGVSASLARRVEEYLGPTNLGDVDEVEAAVSNLRQLKKSASFRKTPDVGLDALINELEAAIPPRQYGKPPAGWQAPVNGRHWKKNPRKPKTKRFDGDPDDVLEPITCIDQSIIDRMMLWHGGQGDPIYKVASSWNAERPVTRELAGQAYDELDSLLRKLKVKKSSRKDIDDLEQLIEELHAFLS